MRGVYQLLMGYFLFAKLFMHIRRINIIFRISKDAFQGYHVKRYYIREQSSPKVETKSKRCSSIFRFPTLRPMLLLRFFLGFFFWFLSCSYWHSRFVQSHHSHGDGKKRIRNSYESTTISVLFLMIFGRRE